MGTPYSLIYKKAITEFKDPTLKQLFSNNSILFFEVMYNYLENAISLFTNPVKTADKLKDNHKPYLYQEQFIGDGQKDTFVLSEFPLEEQLSEVVFECTVNGESVECEYIQEDHQIKVSLIPDEKQDVMVEWYFSGQFNTDLSDEESYILSQFIMACWSEYIMNDKLDIIRLLGDTDFKLPANGTTTTSKFNWNIVNRETVTKRMNHYAWMQSFMKLGDR